MKRGLAWVLIVFLVFGLGACSEGNQSAVEGKLVDGNGKPIAGVKITASQVRPLKGYDQLEAVTSSDGTFRIKGLFPSSAYDLKPWSDKWNSKNQWGSEPEVRVVSAPQGETAVLPAPMVIAVAYLKSNGSLVVDLSTGATRFTVSSDGVITDPRTGLEWVVGPDQDTNYLQAEPWVASCKVAGGGWRMPTRQELRTLYVPAYRDDVKKNYSDSSFRLYNGGGDWVWAEPRDSSSAWRFDFSSGLEKWYYRDTGATGGRVFGVRSRP